MGIYENIFGKSKAKESNKYEVNSKPKNKKKEIKTSKQIKKPVLKKAPVKKVKMPMIKKPVLKKSVLKKTSKVSNKPKKNLSMEEKIKSVKLDFSKNAPGKANSKAKEYVQTFVPGLDELIRPGIPKGSSILIEGGPGSGKTLLCLTILRELCRRGKKVLYMSFEEPEERLRGHIRQFGIDPVAMEKKGVLYIKRFNALDIARSVEALLSEAKKELLIDVQPVLIPQNFKADVVLIDSLTSISSAFSGETSRFRIYMEQLFRYLEANNMTSFLIREVSNPTHVGGTFIEEGEAVSFLSDGIIAIYNVFYKTGVRKRAMEIVKMRGVDIDRRVVELDITEKGVNIYPKRPVTGDYKLT